MVQLEADSSLCRVDYHARDLPFLRVGQADGIDPILNQSFNGQENAEKLVLTFDIPRGDYFMQRNGTRAL
jgi:hypothetical protein